MARQSEKTRYPFPPEKDVWAPFPTEVPWDIPIAELGWGLHIECGCGNSTYYPLRRLAADIGWKRTLRSIVPKLRCSNPDCGRRPDLIALDKEGTGLSKLAYSANNQRLVLRGRSEP